MKDKFLDILKTKTIKDSGVTLIGTGLTGLFGIVFGIVLARNLGKSPYGVFSVSVLILTLLADVANIGIDTGIIRFVGKYKNKHLNKAFKFLKLGLKLKVLMSLIVVFFGWLLAPFIAESIFNKPEFITPLKIVMLGVTGALVYSFSLSTFQALQKFWTWAVFSFSHNALRLLTIVVLSYVGLLSVNTSIGVYILFPFLGFLISFVFLPNFLAVNNEGEVRKEFLKYNRWVALFTLIAAISARSDSFLATRLLNLKDVGIYSVALSVASIVTQIVGALGTVVAPKLSSFDSDKLAFVYLKKLQLFVIGLAIVGIMLGIPMSFVGVPLVYGVSYYNSIYPLIILLFAQAIFLISLPCHMATIYYFSYPRLFVWISLGHLLIVWFLGWILIRNFGYMGAAYTVLVGNIWNFLIPFSWSIRRFAKV